MRAHDRDRNVVVARFRLERRERRLCQDLGPNGELSVGMKDAADAGEQRIVPCGRHVELDERCTKCGPAPSASR